MSPDVIAAGVLSAVLALLGRVVFDWLKPSKHSNSGDNGQAGEKAVSFWRMEFAANKNSFVVEVDRMLRDRDQVIREIIRQELDKRSAILRQIMREELDRRRMK